MAALKQNMEQRTTELAASAADVERLGNAARMAGQIVRSGALRMLEPEGTRSK